MTTFEKVVKILTENRNLSKFDIKPETRFSELELDSLDMMDLVLIMEENFSISIEINEELNTVGKLSDYILNQLNK